jgi:hypothetical protein
VEGGRKQVEFNDENQPDKPRLLEIGKHPTKGQQAAINAKHDAEHRITRVLWQMR